MHFKAKYIILNDMTPIVFPETMNHKDMKYYVAPGAECTGAGFVYVNDSGEYVCYGESTSLRIKSGGDKDSRILNRYLGGKTTDSDLG